MNRTAKKRILNKKGAALAYVLGVSILLLVLCSALMVVARYNLSNWSRGVDGRQTFITADSAIEFAKSHIYRLATDAISKISIGTSDSFYVIKNSENDFLATTSVTPPPDDKLAAECTLTLEKAENVLVQTTKLWNPDGTPFTGEIVGNWTLADYTQEHVAIAPALPSTVFKEFDLSWLPDGAVMQISSDKFTRYIYDAKIDANVKYKNSKRAQTESYSCKVIPGSKVEHKVEAPVTGTVYIGETWGWVATGMNYGLTPLMNPRYRNDNSGGYDNNAPDQPNTHDKTPVLNSDITSKYPVLYTLPIAVFDNNITITAPSFYFKGRYDYSVVETNGGAICFNGGSVNVNSSYLLLSQNLNSHLQSSIGKFNLKKDTIICISPENHNIITFKRFDGQGANEIFYLSPGYYRCKNDVDLFTLNNNGLYDDKDWEKHLEKLSDLNPPNDKKTVLSKAPYNIPFELDALIKDCVGSTTTSQLISSEANKSIDKNPGHSGPDLANRSNGCQWTFNGSLSAYPEFASDREKYRKEFGPTMALGTNTTDRTSNGSASGSFKAISANNLSINKNIFAYITDATELDTMANQLQNLFGISYNRVELYYKARSIFWQYDSGVDFVVPKDMTVTLAAENFIQIGCDNSATIKATDASSSFYLSFPGVGGKRSIVFLKNTTIVPNRSDNETYTIKPGTYILPSLGIDLFSKEAKDFFAANGGIVGGSGGSGGSPVTPPTDSEPEGTTDTKRLASFTEGQYEE